MFSKKQYFFIDLCFLEFFLNKTVQLHIIVLKDKSNNKIQNIFSIVRRLVLCSFDVISDTLRDNLIQILFDDFKLSL